METWKVVNQYPTYAVSDYGRVMRVVAGKTSRVGKILSPGKDKQGYLGVRLYSNCKGKTHRVNILVLEAFAGPRPAGLVCNHKDGNRLNNNFCNLEWVTQSQNIQHAYDMGLCAKTRKRRKKGTVQVCANTVSGR